MAEKTSGWDEKKVLLGLSGGVDSTAAALLLKERGFEVVGYFFDVTGKKTEDFEDARKTAESLDIELISEDISEEFEKTVIDDFISEYMKGRTPNPCVICNPLIKFKHLRDKADEIGAYYIATGHYAKVVESGGAFFIETATNMKKDQSYMLYRLPQEIIRRLLLPLGDFKDKEEIRDIARNFGLKNAEKRDSQEICFIDRDDSYIDYIERRGLSSPHGSFVDTSGNILGEHLGLLHYTIGQRKGLGIAFGRPIYVTRLDNKNNTVTLGENDDLLQRTVVSHGNVLQNEYQSFEGRLDVMAKVRYTAKPTKAVIEKRGDSIVAEFNEPQRAITPGQSIVFYIDGKVIGGGIIDE